MSTPPRVLICRSPSNSRNVTNRAAMIEALKPLNFVAIQPDKLGFDEQTLLFAQAEIIVCEFGAALSNAYFCSPHTKIVEIIAEGQHDPWSRICAPCWSLNTSFCSSASPTRSWPACLGM